MIQPAYDYSEPLGTSRDQFPQDTSIHQILDDMKRREAFKFDLMELAGRVTRPSTPETELFYEVCYEDIYEQMYGDMGGKGTAWLPYGDFAAKLGDQETKEAYKSALQQALEIFESDHAEFTETRNVLYRLAMFWYLRGN